MWETKKCFSLRDPDASSASDCVQARLQTQLLHEMLIAIRIDLVKPLRVLQQRSSARSDRTATFDQTRSASLGGPDFPVLPDNVTQLELFSNTHLNALSSIPRTIKRLSLFTILDESELEHFVDWQDTQWSKNTMGSYLKRRLLPFIPEKAITWTLQWKKISAAERRRLCRLILARITSYDYPSSNDVVMHDVLTTDHLSRLDALRTAKVHPSLTSLKGDILRDLRLPYADFKFFDPSTPSSLTHLDLKVQHLDEGYDKIFNFKDTGLCTLHLLTCALSWTYISILPPTITDLLIESPYPRNEYMRILPRNLKSLSLPSRLCHGLDTLEYSSSLLYFISFLPLIDSLTHLDLHEWTLFVDSPSVSFGSALLSMKLHLTIDDTILPWPKFCIWLANALPKTLLTLDLAIDGFGPFRPLAVALPRQLRHLSLILNSMGADTSKTLQEACKKLDWTLTERPS